MFLPNTSSCDSGESVGMRSDTVEDPFKNTKTKFYMYNQIMLKYNTNNQCFIFRNTVV